MEWIILNSNLGLCVCVHVCVCLCVCVWVGRGLFYLPCWFSLNNSETLEPCHFATFSNILYEKICAKFGIHNLLQFPDITQNSGWGISDFRISGQPLLKENCYNPRTSGDIDMKLGPVTKLDKKNKIISKIFDDNVMSTNCNVIVIFFI